MARQPQEGLVGRRECLWCGSDPAGSGSGPRSGARRGAGRATHGRSLFKWPRKRPRACLLQEGRGRWERKRRPLSRAKTPQWPPNCNSRTQRVDPHSSLQRSHAGRHDLCDAVGGAGRDEVSGAAHSHTAFRAAATCGAAQGTGVSLSGGGVGESERGVRSARGSICLSLPPAASAAAASLSALATQRVCAGRGGECSGLTAAAV